ncbi:hypothetical protein V8E53_004385 [Lactarius tabidus]
MGFTRSAPGLENADLFLIKPPPEVAHPPAKPSYIISGGDLAGGELALAFLQISDLHHPFSSIFLNTDTVRYPLPHLQLSTDRSWFRTSSLRTSLTICKPSPLWPPPLDERRRSMRHTSAGNRSGAVVAVLRWLISAGSQPPIAFRGRELSRGAKAWDRVNVSPHSVQATRTFRLMVCTRAHRSANPGKHPVSDAVKKLYPTYEGIKTNMKPTMVHLQVDNVKYYHRAFAAFIKHVTSMSSTIALEKCKTAATATGVASYTWRDWSLPRCALTSCWRRSAQPSAPTKPTHSRTRRRASNEEARSFRDLQRKMSMRTFQL